TIDGVAPTIAIASPAANAIVGGTTSITANAADNVAVAGVQFKVDGVNLGPEVTTAPFGISWNTTTASNAAHTLTAVARDSAGNTATSSAIVVTVSNHVGPPVISGVAATSISASGASIQWTTDEPADSQVDFGPTAAYGSSSPLAGALVGAHVVQLNGLAPATVYHFRVKSRDAAGAISASGDFTFTTPNVAKPPVISGVTASAITNSGATISWTTDVAGDSDVEYGPTAAYGG